MVTSTPLEEEIQSPHMSFISFILACHLFFLLCCFFWCGRGLASFNIALCNDRYFGFWSYFWPADGTKWCLSRTAVNQTGHTRRMQSQYKTRALHMQTEQDNNGNTIHQNNWTIRSVWTADCKLFEFHFAVIMWNVTRSHLWSCLYNRALCSPCCSSLMLCSY